ncbi:MAG: recombinase RecT [Terracidiphilus sp.]
MAEQEKTQGAPPNALVHQVKIVAELNRYKTAFEQALPRHITADRLARISLTALRKTPKLYMCTLDSFIGSILTAAQVGLEPNVQGQCYLIPYKQECTFVAGWRGLMDLVSRTGRAMAETHPVYDGDLFEYEYGSKSFVRHKPGKFFGDEKALIYTYAIGRVKGMEDFPWLEVWDVDRITLHRNRNNRVGDDHYSYKHWEMYARKIPLLQVIKYLPSSIELATTLDLDASAAEGKQALTIEGVFAQSPDSEGKRVEKELEAEGLMEKLGWDDGKRKSVRESYLSHSGGLDELLGYLGKQSAPLSNGQGQSQQQTQQQSTEGTGKQTTRRGKQHTDSKTEPPQDQAGQQTEQQPSDPAPSTQTQQSEPQSGTRPSGNGSPNLFNSEDMGAFKKF